MVKPQVHIRHKLDTIISRVLRKNRENGYLKLGRFVALCGLMLVLFHSIFALFFSFDKEKKLHSEKPDGKITIQNPLPQKALERFGSDKLLPPRFDIKNIRYKTVSSFTAVYPLSQSDFSLIDTVTCNPSSICISDEFTASVTHGRNQENGIFRENNNRISLKQELIRPEDLDYGKYKGFIKSDKSDRQHIEGFIRIPTVWGMQLKPPDSLKRSVIDIAVAMNRYTAIRAELDPHLILDSHKLLDTPFIFITTDQAFELNEIERQNLGNYLRNGGFVVLDNGNPTHPNGPGEVSLRQMLRDSLGAHARFEPIPVSHPVYHCFFDFDDGPPNGSETYAFVYPQTSRSSSGEWRTLLMYEPVCYLEGIWFNGRLAAIYSDKGFFERWSTNRADLWRSTIPDSKYVLTL